MSNLEQYILIKETGEKVPLFPSLSNEQVASIYQEFERWNLSRARDDLQRMTGCNELEAKLFLFYADQVCKARGMPPRKEKWING